MAFNKLVRGMWCVAGTAGGGGGREAPAHPPAPSCGLYLLPGCSQSGFFPAHSRQEKRPGSLQQLKPPPKCPEAKCDCSPGWRAATRVPPGPCSVCWFWFWGSQCAYVCGRHLSWAEAEVALGVQDHSSEGSSGLGVADLSHHAHQHGARQAGHYSSTHPASSAHTSPEVCTRRACTLRVHS